MEHRFRDDLPFAWQLEQWRRLTGQFDKGQLPHAFLACGSAGLGKTLFVHALARYLLCNERSAGKACGRCRDCRLGAEQPHPDLIVVGPEEDSRDIKIEQIRDLSEALRKTSHAGGAKIAILEKAHRLNGAAANALLKTLEEPTRNTYLFLVSDLPGSLPATIRSRCQRLLFTAPGEQQVSDWLRAHFPADGHEDLKRLARAADCSPLRALAMAENDSLEQRDQFLERLGRLTLHQASPQSLLGLAAKIGERTVVGYLAMTSSIVIKYLLTHSPGPEANGELAGLLGAFAARRGARKQRVTGLLHFHAAAQEASRQLASGSNPNPQLVLESLLWRWSRLP